MTQSESSSKFSTRAQFVRALLTLAAVLLASLAYLSAIAYFYLDSYQTISAIVNRDFMIVSLFIALYWASLETWFNLNEVYRSRSYGYVLFYHVVESLLGTVFLSFTITMLGLPSFGRNVLLLFGGLSFFYCFLAKLIFYACLKRYRRRGHNLKTVVFIADKNGIRLINLLNTRFEWGYQIRCVVADDYVCQLFEGKLRVCNEGNTRIEDVLSPDIDELIYAKEFASAKELSQLIDICNDFGITFRLYSPFFNRLSANTHLRYFDTNAVISISNTPTNYVGLLAKRLFDIGFSLFVIVVGLPVWLIVALCIKADSKGPIFFSQKRSGLRGRSFNVYKFRTMCEDAESKRDELESLNEMNGPVFKISEDPRITRIGKFLRKTGLDEVPQFFNVLVGDMSIVGPRPPLPREVEQYERWQMRRLAMKPGITCVWQVARDRNGISFEEWMRMDLNYIDNWSFTLDIVVIIKTIRTIFRADGH